MWTKPQGGTFITPCSFPGLEHPAHKKQAPKTTKGTLASQNELLDMAFKALNYREEEGRKGKERDRTTIGENTRPASEQGMAFLTLSKTSPVVAHCLSPAVLGGELDLCSQSCFQYHQTGHWAKGILIPGYPPRLVPTEDNGATGRLTVVFHQRPTLGPPLED